LFTVVQKAFRFYPTIKPPVVSCFILRIALIVSFRRTPALSKRLLGLSTISPDPHKRTGFLPSDIVSTIHTHVRPLTNTPLSGVEGCPPEE